MDDGSFILRELPRAKTTVGVGKRAGPDGIPPEAPRNCDLDDIILGFCNLALMQNRQPDKNPDENQCYLANFARSRSHVLFRRCYFLLSLVWTKGRFGIMFLLSIVLTMHREMRVTFILCKERVYWTFWKLGVSGVAILLYVYWIPKIIPSCVSCCLYQEPWGKKRNKQIFERVRDDVLYISTCLQ